jgi:hypothetical protein
MLFVTTGQTFTIGANSGEALLLLVYLNQNRSNNNNDNYDISRQISNANSQG